MFGALNRGNRLYVGYWRRCPALLERVAEMVGARSVRAVLAQGDMCYESDPCAGHGNMRVLLDSGEEWWIADVSSVEIGVVQAHYYPQHMTHFTSYARGYNDWNEARLLRREARVAVWACLLACGVPRDVAKYMLPRMLERWDTEWDSQWEWEVLQLGVEDDNL